MGRCGDSLWCLYCDVTGPPLSSFSSVLCTCMSCSLFHFLYTSIDVILFLYFAFSSVSRSFGLSVSSGGYRDSLSNCLSLYQPPVRQTPKTETACSFCVLRYFVKFKFQYFSLAKSLVSDQVLEWDRKKVKKSKGRYSSLWEPQTPSQSYGTSLAIWDHTVLPATRHKCPA